jgi:Ca-activated chloride channel family protein
MRRFAACLVVLVATVHANAHGLLIPVEKTVPPLAMLNHLVTINVEDQVAVTKVEQTFRNHTSRQLEATYVFPVPKGANVNKFSMWVDGKEVSGELVEAAKAKQIYTDIVRRSQDPGLLEYVGNNLLTLRVFPVLPHGDQKVALSYTSVVPREESLAEYVYPLKSSGKAVSTLEKFSIGMTLKSQHAVQNIYSPSHAIAVKRANDHEATITFERSEGALDRDFQVFWALSDKDIGLTALTHRPLASEHGYFLLSIAPRVEVSESQSLARDMVFVLDTSGSMAGVKMEQAKKALKYCVSQLSAKDRFTLLNFSTTVNSYRDGLVDVSPERIEHAQKWVDELRAAGGTAINDALASALALRTSDESRTFTIVFFTDGQPTVGEANPDKIIKNVAARNSASTRIFTFGVGDDVNATLLDQLAEGSRAVSTYVRPAEDIEVKVSGLYAKISRPVLANLKLTAGKNVTFSEIYPPQLPDLFHGGEIVVLGRYTGQGPCALTLTGSVGKATREYVYELTFPERSSVDRAFVEQLWARRKVGYLLDQVRANGESKELKDELIALAKKYGIATPYTSYLLVPDGPLPVVTRPGPIHRGALPQALAPEPGAARQKTVLEFAKESQRKPGDLAGTRNRFEDERLTIIAGPATGQGGAKGDAAEKKAALDKAREALARKDRDGFQAGAVGVVNSIQANAYKEQRQLARTALRQANGRNCLEVGGVWIDEEFDAQKTAITVKAMSDAYFQILDRQPKMKEVFQLGNHVVWMTPSGSALVIDADDGKDTLTDAEIDRLFVAKR